MNLRKFAPLLLLFAISLHSFGNTPIPDEGVSLSLAQHRKSIISRVVYDLSFSIPDSQHDPVEAIEVVRFTLSSLDDVILDFRGDPSLIHFLSVNGRQPAATFVNSHIIIPSTALRVGRNEVEMEFTSVSLSLNRREDFLYSLFVPDRARTVFPCFDQPDIKAVFRLELTVPIDWMALSNAPVINEERFVKTKFLQFAATKPLPTYLFAFTAGRFHYTELSDSSRTVGAYYRDIDSSKVSQLPEILRQVHHSLFWMEKYTDIPYPFAKYDLVILPGFQFGGMEHAGATFYNDTRLFVPEHPSQDDLLRRTSLIAHETAHMWFGDYVTMRWFDDVWTKEVFANYFAARISEPLFPDIDHSLNFYREFQYPAMAQDRTEGRTSIRQPLDNLDNASLIYNDIIYDKAPVMMRKLVSLMGEDSFRIGIRTYLSRFAFSNASWPDLVSILDSLSSEDISAFSAQWVDSLYWPSRKAVSYRDALDAGFYGHTELSLPQIDSLMADLPAPSDSLMAALFALNENYLHHILSADSLLSLMLHVVQRYEYDELTCLTALDNMREPLRFTPGFASDILSLSSAHPIASVRTKALRLLTAVPTTPEVTDTLLSLWHSASSPYLSEKDYLSLAYELAIRLPDSADSILHKQRSRITNPDLLNEFDFISRACNPSSVYRDSLFFSLREPSERRIEPWTATLLSLLNHSLRQQESVKYITPALEWLPDIQRTGDIFFPARWCNALLSAHRSPEALHEVSSFLDSHPDLNPLLCNKILTALFLLSQNHR